MRIFYTICIVLFILIALYGAISLVKLIDKIANFFSEKTKNVIVDRNILNGECTVTLMNFIIEEIKLEVSKLFQGLSSINIQYDVLKLDEDVEHISTMVFESLKKDTLKINTSIINEEYIMKFIVDNTRLLMLFNIMEMKKTREI